jgi:hypothetical protein
MMTKEEINEVTKDIVSFGVSNEDTDCYLKYVRPLPAGSIVVDFGTGRSKNVTRIALANPEATVITFDNAEENMNLGTIGYFIEICNRFKKAKVDNVYFTLADSMTTFPDWDLPIDVINLDSSHKYEQTKEELRIWLPRIKVGGYIFLHDYNFGLTCVEGEWMVDHRVAGLRQAADEDLKNDNWEWLDFIGATQVVRKLK